MPPSVSRWCLALTALAVFACGGNATSSDGASGGSSTGGAGGLSTGGQATGGASTGGMSSGGSSTGGRATGGTGNVPAYCAVDTSLAPPYAVTFTLTNTQGIPLYLYQGCTLSYSIQSCAEGYSRDLPKEVDTCSAVSCADWSPNACGVCGACADQGIKLDPGASIDVSWTGLLYTVEHHPTCDCYNSQNALSGIYRIEVPIFMSADQAVTQQPAFTVIQQFQLPAPGNKVDVTLFIGV